MSEDRWIRSFEFEFPDHSKLHMETDGLRLDFSFIKMDGERAQSPKEWTKAAILKSHELANFVHKSTEYKQVHGNAMLYVHPVKIEGDLLFLQTSVDFKHARGEDDFVKFGDEIAKVATVHRFNEIEARKKAQETPHVRVAVEETHPAPPPLTITRTPIVEDKIIFAKTLEDGSEMRVAISRMSLQFSVENGEALVEHAKWPQEAVDAFRKITKAVNNGGNLQQDLSASLGVQSRRTTSDGHDTFIYGTVAFKEQPGKKSDDPEAELKAEAGMALDGLGFKGVRGQAQDVARDTGQAIRL